MEPIAITPEEIKSWSSYAVNRTFASEQEARDWIFRQMEQAQINNKGSEYNRQYANQFPLYPFRNAWKVGKPVRKPQDVFRLKDIQVRQPSKTMLYQIGESLTAGPFELGPLAWVPIQELIGDDGASIYSGQTQEIDRIKNLAVEIKNNKWLEAVVIGIEASGERYVIEGQHRVRAMRLLGFKMVPAIAIIEENPPAAVQAWIKANCKFGQVSISAIILQLVKEFGGNPCDVNAGDCDLFAEEVRARIPDAILHETADDSDESQWPYHVFIEYQGRFYDSEAPNGVAKPTDLPIFRRWLRGRKPRYPLETNNP